LMLILVWGSGKLLPVLGRQLGDMSTRINVQLADISDEVIDWADSHIGKGVFRNLFHTEIEQAEKQGQVRQHSENGKPVTQEEKRVIHQSLLKRTAVQLENLITSALPNFINFVGGTLNGLLYFLVGALLTFYFLVDGYKLRREWLYLIPKPARYTANMLLASFHQVMFSFIKGQVMLGMLTGAYMFAIYSIFKVPYAFLLGCIFALAELLPVVGTWIGITIGLTVILLNMPPIVALWVWLCSYCFQTVKDNILAPKVVGDVMGLHPMVIILSLLVCAKIAGLLGVLVALPLASIINVIIRMLLQREDAEKSVTEQPHA
jgi:predicted PurR-regulated permease PerM